MTTSLLPTLIGNLVGISNAPIALGVIMGFADSISTFMKLLSGYLSDRIKYYKPVIVLGYVITPIFVTLIGTAHYIWQVFFYQTFAWFGRGLREPIRDVWLSNVSDTKNYGKIFGLQRAFDTIGAILGPLLAFFTIPYFSLKTIFFIAFIPGLISIFTILFLTTNYKSKSEQTKKLNLIKHIKMLPKKFNFFIFVMFFFGIANFNKTLLIFRAQELFFNQTNSSIIATSSAILLYVLFNLIRAISEFAIGTLSDYVNRKFLIAFFGFSLFGLTCFLLLIAQTQLALWIIIFICAGCSSGSISSVEKSYAAQLLPTESRGIGFGLLQSVDGVGDLLSSVIVGLLWSYFSYNIAFIYSALLSIIAVFLILIIDNIY